MGKPYLITDYYTITDPQHNSIQPKGYDSEGNWVGYKEWERQKFAYLDEKHRLYLERINSTPISIAEGHEGTIHVYTDIRTFTSRTK